MTDFPHIAVRPATFDDVDNIVSLTRKKGVKEGLPWVKKVTLENDISRREQGYSGHQLYVACAGDKLIGFIRFLHRMRPEKDGVWQTTLHEIAVDPEYQQLGIGGKLLSVVKEHTLSHRLDKNARILIKVPADIMANTFYQKHGFLCQGHEESEKGRQINIYCIDLEPHKFACISPHINQEAGLCR